MAEEPRRKCSNCLQNGHNSRTCKGKGSIKLFGVNIKVSEDNEAAQERRRRGTAWSEDEHRRFLMGLEKLGKGKWKAISEKFVHSRDPTQVASHAQKHFLRLATTDKRKRFTSSVFDIGLEEPHPPQTPRSQASSSSSNRASTSTAHDHVPSLSSSSSGMTDLGRFAKIATAAPAFVPVMNFPCVWWPSFHGAPQLIPQQFHTPASTSDNICPV